MKKALSVLLGLFLIFSLISCNEEVVEESEIIESADESVILDEFVLSDNVAKINSYLTNEVDRSLLATNVFKGLTYTLSRDTVEEHSDIGLKLTNGETVDMFDTYSFLGWKDRMPVSIDFDLGDSKHSIADITVECLRVMDYGIGLPEYISVQVSDDGEEYTDIGRIYTPKDIPDSTKFEYSFAFPKGSSARYFRIYCSEPDNAFTFIDEISAYDYNSDGTIDRNTVNKPEQHLTVNDFYDYNLNLGESTVKVSKDDADYNETQNLARLEGVDFQIQHFPRI